MVSKFRELSEKMDEMAEQVVDKFTGKGKESDEAEVEAEEDSKQEYYEPRTDDQIIDGGKMVLGREQIDEARAEAEARGEEYSQEMRDTKQADAEQPDAADEKREDESSA